MVYGPIFRVHLVLEKSPAQVCVFGLSQRSPGFPKYVAMRRKSSALCYMACYGSLIDFRGPSFWRSLARNLLLICFWLLFFVGGSGSSL